MERESADLRSDEIESRVNSGSMDGLNVTLRPRALPTSATAQSLASSSSPPTSGHSTPKHHSRNASHHLGIMTLVREHTHSICHTHTNSSMVIVNRCISNCVLFCLIAKRLEETPQESCSKFANTTKIVRTFCPTVAYVTEPSCFCDSCSLQWKWTKLLSNVRHRLPRPPAVYGWKPISPSSQAV